VALAERTRTEQIGDILNMVHHVWMIHSDLSLMGALEKAGFRLNGEDDKTDDDLLEDRLSDYLRRVMKSARDVT
jgi:hypothetical protein